MILFTFASSPFYCSTWSFSVSSLHLFSSLFYLCISLCYSTVLIFPILPYQSLISSPIFSSLLFISFNQAFISITIIFFSEFEIRPLSKLILIPNYNLKILSIFVRYVFSNLLAFRLPSEALDFCICFL